ncbi:Cytochrome P450 85A1 [Triticum urartu]|uniref:Cytochrome P450 85A1 n=1 Tax=Triticum urartu TaxID=4572 RepID=M7YXH7_TRIUA|nr:Cytochrome P450 85A1 [Triticum urartu]
MALLLVLVGVVAGVVLASSLLLRWNEVRYGNGRRRHGDGCLPPGTMGWPLFGETTEFLKQGPSFMKQRRLRYGRLFRTHILGCPTVMALLSALRQIAGITAGPLSDALKTELYTLVLGTISLPINIPGTSYYQGFQARKKLVSMLEQMIAERRLSGDAHDDMLDALLRSGDDGTREKLSDEQIIDLLIALIYSGYETMSTTSMMAVKYLSEHPRALDELRREHLDIRTGKSREEAISYEDFKSMAFTRAVIFETLRLATVVNGLLRKTTQDVEMNGYVIPKGWRIYVYTREINYDPFMYPDPMTFNPWRWLEKNMESHPHFMLFGGGGRMCPGKEVGTAEIATFLHYFVTRYRWEEEGKNTILKFPRVEAPNGLHIRVQDY